MITDVQSLPPHPNLEQYRKQAKDLLKAWKSRDVEAVERVRKFHPRKGEPSFGLAGAQLTVAREHGFESWPKFARHVESLARAASPVSQFEQAADAIAEGDLAMLDRLLLENPTLIRARSTRAHRGTLLHYIGANGLEDYRQKTPPNAPDILRLLLRSGAEVNAEAHMYRGDTALELVATSIHPLVAGVQQEMLEILLAAGSTVDSATVRACVANGRGRAAEFLAARVDHLDLEAAAGVGRLEQVRAAIEAGASQDQIQSALGWAAEYGRVAVLEFLLKRGAEPGSPAHGGQTALHWAAVGGQAEAARILIRHGAALEIKNVYGGTPLDQAVWSALHDSLGIDYMPVIEALLAAGADPKAVVLPTGNARIDDVLRRAISATES